MSTRTEVDFKKALQALTTTVVKVEAGGAADELRAGALTQWRKVLELHAALAAEWSTYGTTKPLPHAGWFEKTVARAEAAFGPLPAA